MPRASKREISLFPHIRRGTARIDGMLVDSSFVRCSVHGGEVQTIRFPLQVAGRVLGDRGWLKPTDPHRAVCPDCARRAEVSKVAAVSAVINPKPSPQTPQSQESGPAMPKGYPNPKPAPSAPVVSGASKIEILRADAPPVPTAADRRRIYDAVEARYDLTGPCYTGNWTDAKLAEAVNVPRAWVAEVRGQFFGPDISAERRAAPAKLLEHETRLKAIEDKHMALAAEAEKERAACRETRLALETNGGGAMSGWDALSLQWGPWIDWPGGPCPLARGTLCQVMFVNGDIWTGRALMERSGGATIAEADVGISWLPAPQYDSEGVLVIAIIAYRLPVDDGLAAAEREIEVAA